MKTIVLLTDFSEVANHAIGYAVEMSRALQGRLVFLHTMYFNNEVPGITNSVSGMTWADPSLYTPTEVAMDQDREKVVKDKLWNLVEEVRQNVPDVEIQGEVLRGTGMDTVVDFLKAHNVSLVVMGTTGADSALDRWVGTTVTYLMNHASCPVLAVPQHSQFTGFKKIVYAIDPYNEAEWHLKELQDLAQTFGAEVTVLYVQADPESQKSQDRWQAFTSKWELQAPTLGYARVFSDKLAPSMEEYARSKQADLLVVSKQNRSFWDKLFGSSPADTLVHDNVLPVLSLPAISK